MQHAAIEKPSILFLVLAALMTSFTAVSIDMLLPTLPHVAQHFDVSAITSQQVITCLVFGIFLGEIIFGPLSDVFGRKPLIISGSISFIIGAVWCAHAQSYEELLAARVLQGFGAAGPKIAVRALLRDLYSGVHLARVYSMVFMILMIIPISAPIIGQWITSKIGWEGEFLTVAGFCFVATLLFTLMQKETLSPDKRTTFNIWFLFRTVGLIFAHQKVFLLTLLLGLVFSINLTYLGTAQQIFKNYYGIEHNFPYYFGFLATAIAVAYLASAKLVNKIGGIKLCAIAIGILIISTATTLLASILNGGTPPFAVFLVCFFGLFFSYGILWANVAVLAIEYLGAAAGLGSTFISAGASLIGFLVTGFTGGLYDANYLHLGLGFLGMSLLALICFLGVIKSRHNHALSYVKMAATS
ncbi:MAG: MFS transporter [Pseudomonadota bacterium]|nr:MFS transporter [Pseudomonadota bacterium]